MTICGNCGAKVHEIVPCRWIWTEPHTHPKSATDLTPVDCALELCAECARGLRGRLAPPRGEHSEAERAAAGERILSIRSRDPLDVLGSRFWPTTRPTREDGSLDVSAWCRQLDESYNAGLGEPRA